MSDIVGKGNNPASKANLNRGPHPNFKRRLARAQMEFQINSDRAVAQILSIMENAPESAIRLKAAMFVLQKGFGERLNVPIVTDPNMIESLPRDAKLRGLAAVAAELGVKLVDIECSNSESLPDSTYEIIESSDESDVRVCEPLPILSSSPQPVRTEGPTKFTSTTASPPSTDAAGYARSLRGPRAKSSSRSRSEAE